MLQRIARHLVTTATRTRRLFNPAVCERIETAITVAEQQHRGEIRFAVETALPMPMLWRGLTPRDRALQLFAQLHVWDTEANNGVLIYVLRADRAIEIVADRGISARVGDGEWQSLCGEAEARFRTGIYADGALVAIDGVARVLGRHFPRQDPRPNELPNQPVLL
ncbi:MAG TPA: TPM domain-containing protein [Steroidobacteraceae bacterium]|jgi:uncharacterized membrane protein|nr:TPM domain-containing protein [Steroidobacteraceae bacterium]